MDYEAQLKAVENTLLVTDDEAERTELTILRSNLQELLALTKETTTADENATAKKENLDEEMQRFMSELGDIEAASAPEAEGADDVSAKLSELKDAYGALVGQKCAAPHQHSWGAETYHNAIVCGLEDSAEVGSNGDLDVRLRVLFTNPTHREMLPCTYYLEGECRFDDERCHYSHGELVSVNQLREYVAPDFERLARNCVVLAKMKDRLWHRGRVLCANFVEKLCRVRLDGKDQKEREKDFAFEDLFPIFHDEDLSSGSSSDSADDSDSEELNDRHAQLVEQSLFTFKPTQALGEWEKHTRGIGSKLMAKMGYIHGTGLGSEGRGIVIPVSAQILPQGRSLDYCMDLREAANGDKNLFSVEKKLRRDHKKQTAINEKAYQRESQRVDVFSFLNDNVLSALKKNDHEVTSAKTTVGVEKPSLQQQTTKSLNVESVRIADDIRRKEREIAKLEETMRRNASGTDIHKRLHNARTQELHDLKQQEKGLSKEQDSRRTKNKLIVF